MNVAFGDLCATHYMLLNRCWRVWRSTENSDYKDINYDYCKMA